MKRSITAALVAAFCLAGAATLTPVAPVWTLYKGSTVVAPRVAYADSAACVVGANAQVVAKATKFYCKSSSSSTVVDQLVTTTTTVATSILTTVLPAPVMTGPGVPYNHGKIPAPGVGIGTDNISPTVQFPEPSADGTGDFRTVCYFSHMAADDPIVLPGQPGASHLHAFVGNMLANANSTVASISSTGNTTCRGGTINRSAYWQPAIIDTKDGTPIPPRAALIYYKSGGAAVPADVQELPLGLRMVAGDSKGSAPVAWGAAGFSCNGESQGSKWDFSDPTQTNAYQIPNCPVGGEVWASVAFPNCWDGVNLDSPDHKSHLAYWPSPNPYADATHPWGKCPPTHPVTLPQISITFMYPVTEAGSPLRWRLASDMYTGPAGYSLHADWFGGWKPDIVHTWTTLCINAAKDCSAHMLGDGRTMAEATP